MCTLYQVGGTGKRQEASSGHVIAAYLRWLIGNESAAHLVRPTNLAPVIMPGGKVEIMHWGFRMQVTGAKPGKLIARTVVNAREDKLDSRTWKSSFAERRCIIPADGYYEWTGPPGSKQAHFFRRPDFDTMWIAGIWTEHPERGLCYSMITTEPNRVAAFVHDRMPAVLREEEIEPFLAGAIRHFRPAEDTLQAEAVASPLSPKKPDQGELF